MKAIQICCAATSAALLTACGGSSTSTTGGFAFEQDGALTIAELNDAGNALAAFATEVNNNTITGQTPAALAAEGSATYSGYMLGEVQTEDNVIVGRATLNADFTGGGSLDGTVTDMVLILGSLTDAVPPATIEDIEAFTFTDLPDTTVLNPIAGELTLSGGAITEVDGRADIAIDVTGTATVPAALSITTNEEVYNVTGNLSGGVGTDNTLVGVGEIKAESNDAGFDLDTVIFAR